jgi:hypothetical protein
MRFAVLTALVFVGTCSFGQSYRFVRVAGESMPRPDGAGPFGVGGELRPSIEGDYVVFRDPGFFGSVKKQAIWSYNLADGSFIRLVDQETPAPGGTGNFSEFFYDSQPILKNGYVTFLARDDKPLPYNQGIYTVPVTGGPIQLVANYNTPDPSGGNFINFDMAGKPFGGFYVADPPPMPPDADPETYTPGPGRIVFWARNPQNVFGLYSALPDGSELSVIADVLRPYRPKSVFPVSIFGNGVASGDTAVFQGQTAFDPSTGFNALYSSPVTGPTGLTEDGSPDYVEILTHETPLPGNPNPDKFHTRINLPSLQMEGDRIAFVADDSNSKYRGIFTISMHGGEITPVVTGETELEGLGTVEAVNGSFNGLTLNHGRILFKAVDTTPGFPGNHGLFVWNPEDGTHKRVVGTGDKIDDDTVNVVLHPACASMSGGRIVFVAWFRTQGAAVYVAVPEEE